MYRFSCGLLRLVTVVVEGAGAVAAFLGGLEILQ